MRATRSEEEGACRQDRQFHPSFLAVRDPGSPELHLETVGHDPAELAFEIEQFLERRMEQVRMSVRVGRLDHWRLEAAAAVPGLLTTRRP